MGQRTVGVLGLALLLAALGSPSNGLEIETKHATVVYEDAADLAEFNSKLRLRGLLYLLWKKKSVHAVEETRDKIDAIVDKVQTILEMRPSAFHFRLVLLPSREGVRVAYREKFNRYSDYIAFYSPEDETVYVSVDDVRLGVFAHEVAHAVIDHYFEVSPPVKVHELLAQYVEAQIKP